MARRGYSGTKLDPPTAPAAPVTTGLGLRLDERAPACSDRRHRGQDLLDAGGRYRVFYELPGHARLVGLAMVPLGMIVLQKIVPVIFAPASVPPISEVRLRLVPTATAKPSDAQTC